MGVASLAGGAGGGGGLSNSSSAAASSTVNTTTSTTNTTGGVTFGQKGLDYQQLLLIGVVGLVVIYSMRKK